MVASSRIVPRSNIPCAGDVSAAAGAVLSVITTTSVEVLARPSVS